MDAPIRQANGVPAFELVNEANEASDEDACLVEGEDRSF
jgi:hypothetical protein